MAGEKDCRICFRCSTEERDFILERSENFQSVSEFIRIMIFEKCENRFFDGKVNDLLRKLDWDNVKIGTNINQVVKGCNSRKYISKTDLDEILKYQNLLIYKFEQLVLALHRMQEERKNGNHKIAPN